MNSIANWKKLTRIHAYTFIVKSIMELISIDRIFLNYQKSN